MPINPRKLYGAVNRAKCAASRGPRGERGIRDSSAGFRGLPVSVMREITEETDEGIRKDIEDTGVSFSSCEDIDRRAADMAPRIIRNAFVGHLPSQGTAERRVIDSVLNPALGIGTYDDTMLANTARPNIWISPAKAASLYSQKGLLEQVVNKKSKSVLLNGLKIRNPRFTAHQIDRISEDAMRLDFQKVVADAICDSLAYGGDVVFPLFAHDTPVTMSLGFEGLLRSGLLTKKCISRFISLDRWNTWIVPPISPTQKDYLEPDVYFIPYMGCDVNHARTARIVTAPQAGWWGKMLTQGWGISDFCGYYESYEQYKVVMGTLPFMIQQMSILVRTINLDAVLATQGANVLEDLMADNQVKAREATPENPVNMDVMGDLKSINRNFGQVPEMIKLLRQGFAADAGIPEPMLFSSEKGNFSSGDDTQGNLSKQWENVKYIHKDVELQLRRLAMLIAIDALGPTKEVLEALPYTTIQFDSPIIANATEKADIAEQLAKAYFDLVGGQMPMDKAAEIAFSFAGDDMSLGSDMLDQLKAIQTKADEQRDEKFRMDMKVQKASLEGGDPPKAPAKSTVSSPNVRVTQTGTGGENTSKTKYTRLEQKMHEKTRGTSKRAEGLAKARNKLSRLSSVRTNS